MSTPPTNQESIKRYLLGQLPEQAESDVEGRLLTDRDFYDELSIVEDELIDQYLGGALSDSDRRSFETHFVSSPERRQKVRFARALRKYVAVSADRNKSSRPSFFNFPLSRPAITLAMAACLILVAGATFFLIQYRYRAPGGKVLAIELTPGPLTRGGDDVKEFSLGSDVGSVRLQLDLPENDYQTYEAVVRDASMRDVLTTGKLEPEIVNGVAAVTINVKADLLAPGDYRVNLSGTTAAGRKESVATFAFTVRAN